jgi:Carboxypeptidase regulatory-like domain/TonB dependent receptor-like, beta-barrel
VRVPAIRTRVFAWLALSLLLSTGNVYAQAGTAGLTGTVTDEQGAVLPGVTLTVSNASNGFVRTTTSTGDGTYQLLALPPGTYSLKVELQNFRTVVYESVPLQVDTVARQNVKMSIGGLTEAVQVTAEPTTMNTTDASLGNVISGNQLRALPLEGRSVVGLLSLQAGAVYVPTNTLGDQDNRSGAVSGARADQSNVTLDGVDNNDPLYNTAYTGALRSTLDSLQEFRVTTSNYNADSGRSSSAQVSLVTKSGANQFHGSGYDVLRRTSTSSNEYFNKLAGNDVPLLDKNIYGGSFGGALIKDKLFFFGNYERLKEDSEALAERGVPSLSMRDGVMVYQCADPAQCPGGTVQGFANSHTIDPGYYGATPSQLAGLDPLGIGPSVLASDYFSQLPAPNDAGLDGYNIMAYKFTAPFSNTFNTTIGRLDYRPSGNHSFFGRFNVQRDTELDVPQYPDRDLPPNTTTETKSWGMALAWDSILSPTLINTFRYGYTKMVFDRIGTLTGPLVYFRFIDDLNEAVPLGYTNNGRRTPAHNFVNDTTWLKGRHTVKFGTNLRFTRIPSYTDANSFSYGSVNPSWVNGVGRAYTPGRDSCNLPGCAALPAVADGWNFADPWIVMLGVVSQGNGQYNYDGDGNLLPVGEAARRRYAMNEYEFYAQDSWRIGDKLTINGGLRYSLASPPWETNGLQVAPSVSLGERFAQRQEMMLRGIPENTLPDIQFVLAGPENGRKGFYDWDKNNFAPRISAAWTPTNRFVVRGGYSLVYDRIGMALANNFDALGSFGLSTTLTSEFGGTNEDDPSVRFQGIDVLPPSVPAAPPGGFPQTPPPSSDIYETIDDTLVTPYAHTFNAVASFEITKKFTIEAAYVGRQGRNLLTQRDLYMPLNLVDAQSGTDYFTASTELIKQLETNGFDPSVIAPIAYFENMFPDAAGVIDGFTATQVMADEYAYWYPDHQSAMFDFDIPDADGFCIPACTRFGGNSYLNRQYASAAALSTIGRSKYNALQLTLRRRYSDGYQFDFNYTYGFSKDHGSLIERNSNFSGPVDFGLGGYTGFLINSWDPDQQFSYSDFDIRHQINFNWVSEFPWGRGKKWGSDMPGWLDAVVGGWSMAGLTRWTSGLPFNVINARSAWATNWNLQGNASLRDPNRLPPTGTTKNVLNGKPSPFTVSPEEALQFFRFDYPGEAGIRNRLRGDGYFSLDFSLAKSWQMPYSHDHRFWFRWDTFNVTNTPRFDVANVTMFPDRTSTFGTYNGTYASCDGNAGRCMQFSLRYEF